jgi:hypothetical protein
MVLLSIFLYSIYLHSKLGEKSASPRKGTGYHPKFDEN